MCRRKSLLCSAWENDGTFSQLGKFCKEHDECFWCNMTECWFWISGIIPSYTGYAGLYIYYIYNTFFLCIWDSIGDFSLCFWRETENGIPVFDLLVKTKNNRVSSGVPRVSYVLANPSCWIIIGKFFHCLMSIFCR